jgi:hypothetical protein
MKIIDFLEKYFLKLVREDDPFYPYWGDVEFDSELFNTTKWFTTDTLFNYIKKGNKKYSTDDIFYDINEHGFRINSKSLESNDKNKEIIACFGCSQTMGVGLPWEHTWVSNLNELLEKKYEVKNYGVSGASNDNISRLIYNYTLINKPKIICCFFPELTRIELIDEELNYLLNYTDSFLSMTFNCSGLMDLKFQEEVKKIKEKQKKVFYAYQTIYKEKNSLFNFIKNFKFIQMTCKLNNIDFYWGSWSSELKMMSKENIKKYFDIDSYIDIDSSIFSDCDYARDNVHLGEMSNKKIADNFYKKIIRL